MPLLPLRPPHPPPLRPHRSPGHQAVWRSSACGQLRPQVTSTLSYPPASSVHVTARTVGTTARTASCWPRPGQLALGSTPAPGPCPPCPWGRTAGDSPGRWRSTTSAVRDTTNIPYAYGQLSAKLPVIMSSSIFNIADGRITLVLTGLLCIQIQMYKT